MNQDRVKDILLSVRPCETEFSVVFSGKKSDKVNGLYKPEAREIIIHNHNFDDDNQLIYTALHEYAHHLHAEKFDGKITCRAHGAEFWSILHSLLDIAEEKKIYLNPVEAHTELKSLADKIKTACLAENGRIMKEFGMLLMEAEKLCKQYNARFEDFMDRVLQVPRTTAKAAMLSNAYDVPSTMGFDAMKLVSGIKNPEKRNEAIHAFSSGQSQDTIRHSLKATKNEDEIDPETKLVQERSRIEKTIQKLQDRLEEINSTLGI